MLKEHTMLLCAEIALGIDMHMHMQMEKIVQETLLKPIAMEIVNMTMKKEYVVSKQVKVSFLFISD